jgi:hypothetical protein
MAPDLRWTGQSREMILRPEAIHGGCQICKKSGQAIHPLLFSSSHIRTFSVNMSPPSPSTAFQVDKSTRLTLNKSSLKISSALHAFSDGKGLN